MLAFYSLIVLFPTTFAQVAPPDCVLTCIGASTTATSCAPSDTSCLCSSPLFIEAVAGCLAKGCGPADQAAGVKFGQAYCASIGAVVSIPIEIASQASQLAAGTAVVNASVPIKTPVLTTSLVTSTLGPVITSSIASVVPTSTLAPVVTPTPSVIAARSGAIKTGISGLAAVSLIALFF